MWVDGCLRNVVGVCTSADCWCAGVMCACLYSMSQNMGHAWHLSSCLNASQQKPGCPAGVRGSSSSSATAGNNSSGATKTLWGSSRRAARTHLYAVSVWRRHFCEAAALSCFPPCFRHLGDLLWGLLSGQQLCGGHIVCAYKTSLKAAGQCWCLCVCVLYDGTTV